MTVSGRRRALAALVFAAMLASLPSLALAGYATSGTQYRETNSISGYGNIRSCLEAWIITQGVGTGNTANGGGNHAYNATGGLCDGAVTLPAGWLGVTHDAYRDGGFCGTTFYRYTDTATSGIGYQSINLCSNPAGSQVFHSNVFGKIYNGSTYLNISGLAGPAQNG